MILALDPGRDKVGLALTGESGRPLELKILAREETVLEVKKIITSRRIEALVLGDGTHSRELLREIKRLLQDLRAESLDSGLPGLGLVEEKGSTEEAINFYRQANPGGHLKKLVLQVMDWKPAQPLDHYAALVLARRYLEKGFQQKISY